MAKNMIEEKNPTNEVEMVVYFVKNFFKVKETYLVVENKV